MKVGVKAIHYREVRCIDVRVFAPTMTSFMCTNISASQQQSGIIQGEELGMHKFYCIHSFIFILTPYTNIEQNLMYRVCQMQMHVLFANDRN
jgi:hypothetical protein